MPTPVVPFKCSNSTTVNPCNCSVVTIMIGKNSSVAYNCNCSNATTKVPLANLNLNQTNCSCSNVTLANKNSYLACNCCLSTVPTVIPIVNFTCGTEYVRQGCQCRNVTDPKTKKWFWQCNCTNQETQVTTPLNHAQDLCSCNGTACNCCLT